MKTIIEMAREASNTPIDHHATPDLFGINQIERFAALVRAEAQAEEREACAKVAEDMNRAVLAMLNVTSQPKALAEAIRARGNT